MHRQLRLCFGGCISADRDKKRRDKQLQQVVAEERQRYNAPGRTPLAWSVEWDGVHIALRIKIEEETPQPSPEQAAGTQPEQPASPSG